MQDDDYFTKVLFPPTRCRPSLYCIRCTTDRELLKRGGGERMRERKWILFSKGDDCKSNFPAEEERCYSFPMRCSNGRFFTILWTQKSSLVINACATFGTAILYLIINLWTRVNTERMRNLVILLNSVRIFYIIWLLLTRFSWRPLADPKESNVASAQSF